MPAISLSATEWNAAERSKWNPWKVFLYPWQVMHVYTEIERMSAERASISRYTIRIPDGWRWNESTQQYERSVERRLIITTDHDSGDQEPLR